MAKHLNVLRGHTRKEVSESFQWKRCEARSCLLHIECFYIFVLLVPQMLAWTAIR